MGILSRFTTKPRTVAAAEARLADHAQAEQAARDAIADLGRQRNAALLADAPADKIDAIDRKTREQQFDLEKLELARPHLMADLDNLRDAARRKLRADLIATHEAAIAPYVAAHRAAVDAMARVLTARNALIEAGFRAEAEALPMPPPHVIDLGKVQRGTTIVAAHPDLDTFEERAARAHAALRGDH